MRLTEAPCRRFADRATAADREPAIRPGLLNTVRTPPAQKVDILHKKLSLNGVLCAKPVWAMAYRPECGWGVSHESAPAGAEPAANAHELEDLRRRVAELENSMRTGGR